MNRTDKIKAKFKKQQEAILRDILNKFPKFRSKQSKKEVSNQEDYIAQANTSASLWAASNGGLSEGQQEKVDDALTQLTEEEVSVIKKRFWEAKSFAIIGNELGHPHDPKWAFRKLAESLEKLKKYLG